MGNLCSRCLGNRDDDDGQPSERQPLLNNEHPPIFHQPLPKRNLQDSIHEEQSLKAIVDRTRANTINIKELNAQTTSIMHLDFGERSLKYQKLVKSIKAPSPELSPEEVPLSEEEREFMSKAARDVKSALGSMRVKDVGQVVIGFNL